MKKYSILDIHDSLRTNLGADFDVEAPMFVDNYVNNENFRAASHEAMTKLDPEFTTQAIEHNEDTLKKVASTNHIKMLEMDSRMGYKGF